jgi:predicted RNA-binding Zn-ribbon protein involved in translation (DUF1610 family)
VIVVAYQCPRCGDPVHRGANPGAAAVGGLIGALVASAFGSFQCKKCGTIPRSEFSPEVRSQMMVGSIVLIVVAIVVLVLVIALVAYLATLSKP